MQCIHASKTVAPSFQSKYQLGSSLENKLEHKIQELLQKVYIEPHKVLAVYDVAGKVYEKRPGIKIGTNTTSRIPYISVEIRNNSDNFAVDFTLEGKVKQHLPPSIDSVQELNKFRSQIEKAAEIIEEFYKSKSGFVELPSNKVKPPVVSKL